MGGLVMDNIEVVFEEFYNNLDEILKGYENLNDTTYEDVKRAEQIKKENKKQQDIKRAKQKRALEKGTKKVNQYKNRKRPDYKKKA